MPVSLKNLNDLQVIPFPLPFKTITKHIMMKKKLRGYNGKKTSHLQY